MEWQNFAGRVFAVNNGTPSDIRCNTYSKGNNTFIIYDGYMGIPQNLFINTVAWVLLIMLFAILRKMAWNYGRIALVQRNEQRELLHKSDHYNVWTQLFYGDCDLAALGYRGTGPGVDADSVDSQDAVLIDQGFFSWITAIFRVKDTQILKRSGPDAIQYLSFQRYLLAYMGLLTIICLVVVLPVNFQGDLEGDRAAFGHTTMINLEPKSYLLWIHVLLSVVLLPIGVYFMRHFSVNLKFEENQTISCTLMITDIPKDKCSKSLLVQHFEEAYPDVVIQDMQFAYNIKDLIRTERLRETASEAKAWSECYNLKNKGNRLMIYPCPCSWVLCCCKCCGCRKEDAALYYGQQEDILLKAVDREKAVSMEKPLGICFITFQNEVMASKVTKDHHHTCKCGVNPPSSSVSRFLEPYRWSVTNAPIPDDLYWENLSSNSENWYLRAFCINFFIFLILFFLTTPFVVITSLDVLRIINVINQLNPLLGRFLPTLLLWTVAALMPVLVSYSDQFVRHWTRSSENHTVMRKTFIFLLFMIVILPSLGLTSAKAFVEWALMTKNQTMRWECVFLPDNGAFYVNYVITSSFVGTALELIRFPELFMYVVRLCAMRSVAERISVRKAILWEFPFGTQYAWFLLVFAVTVIYSISCPLIAPFGLIYMFFKHCVDRHNIIFAYGPSKINKNIHVTAINFVVASILLMQMMVLFFMLLRRGFAEITVFSIVFFCISTAIFVGQIFFNVFKGFSPILYSQFKNEDQGSVETAEVPSVGASPSHVIFTPHVLNRRKRKHQSALMESNTADGSPVQRTYGTNFSDGETEDDVRAPVDPSAFEPTASETTSVNTGPLYQDYEQRSSNGLQTIPNSGNRDLSNRIQNQPLQSHYDDVLSQPI